MSKVYLIQETATWNSIITGHKESDSVVLGIADSLDMAKEMVLNFVIKRHGKDKTHDITPNWKAPEENTYVLKVGKHTYTISRVELNKLLFTYGYFLEGQ